MKITKEYLEDLLDEYADIQYELREIYIGSDYVDLSEENQKKLRRKKQQIVTTFCDLLHIDD